MSVVATPISEPRVREWTRQEYHRMGELGWFNSQRVQLIGGEIIQMSPQGSGHSVAIELTRRQLERVFGKDYWIRIQLPLSLTSVSEPEPDLSVIRGQPRDFRDEHPSRAVLVVEVSDSTLAFDLGQKAGLYASVGILDYWVIDLVNQRVVSHRSPVPDASQPFGFAYANITRTEPNGFVSPLALLSERIAVSDLLA